MAVCWHYGEATVAVNATALWQLRTVAKVRRSSVSPSQNEVGEDSCVEEKLPVIKNISWTHCDWSPAEIGWLQPQQRQILLFCCCEIGFIELRHTHAHTSTLTLRHIVSLNSKLTNSDRYCSACRGCRKHTHSILIWLNEGINRPPPCPAQSQTMTNICKVYPTKTGRSG